MLLPAVRRLAWALCVQVLLPRRRFLWAVLGAYWVLIFVMTHLPPDNVPRPPGNDKLMHFGAYAGLGFLLGLTLRLNFPARRWTTWAALAVGFAYGIVDEALQPLVRRTADPMDWLADACGVTFAVVLLVVLRRLLPRWTHFGAASPPPPA